MIGERGGHTRTLEEGQALIEQHKASLAQSIRDDILSYLSEYGEWHRNNLRVEVPADSKNAVGAAVNGLINSGLIEETGERRKSSDPASHGRKSNVYRKAGTGGSVTGLGSSAASSGAPVPNDETVARFRSRIRWQIAEDLVLKGEFKVENLDDLRIPDDCQFLIREAIDTAKRRGYMEGERGAFTVTSAGTSFLRKMVIGSAEEVTEESRTEPAAEVLPLDIPDPEPVSHYMSEAA